MTTKPVLAVLDAHYFWTRELFTQCREQFDVLLLKPRDFRAQRRELGRWSLQLSAKPLSEGVWEMNLPMPPGWLFGGWGITQRVLAMLIKRFAAGRPLVLASCYPFYLGLEDRLQCPLIYYSIDDYHDYWPRREKQTEELERRIVAKADCCVCVAEYRTKLFQSWIPQGDREKIMHLPHGCSPAFMVEKPLLAPLDLPQNLNNHRRPIGGYVGALNNRFDFAFLSEVATLRPNVTFLLGGDPPKESEGSAEWYQGVQAARQLPNVHFIGRVPHGDIGRHLQSFDVLLMCYSESRFNTSACPMKLWDYMGTSRPVVANAAVPEVLLWESVIRVVLNPEGFAGELDAALVDTAWKASERLAIARENSWKRQGEKLLDFLSIQQVIVERMNGK